MPIPPIGGTGGTAPGIITQEVVQAFVSNFPGLGVIQVRATQYVVQAFVNDTPVTTPPTTGVNVGTPVCHPYSIHLDRKCRLLGVYNAGSGKTVWTLPIADSSLTTVVLASTSFGADNGKVFTGSYGAGAVSVSGDYSASYAIVGRAFTMSVELSRPFRRLYSGEAVISDRVQLGVFYASYRNTGDLTIRASSPVVPARSDRSKSYAAPVGTVTEEGELRFLLSGRAEETRVFLESATPRPVTVPGVRWTGDFQENQG